MKTRISLKLAFAVIVLGSAAVAFLVWHTSALRWRAQAVILAATGQVPDLSTGDALRMVRPGSGYWLESLTETRNAYATIKNPFTSAADVATGIETFRTSCAGCHGADARGGTAPALIGRTLTHGDSDWAMLRTVRDGVPGTSMPPHPWDYKRMWQAIAYVRSKDTAHAGDAEAIEPLPANFDLPYDELKAINATNDDWPAYAGSYSGQRHSALTQINRDNVSRLAPRWIYQFAKQGERIQMSPVVRKGIMFVTHAAGVYALDARSGKQIWAFDRPIPDNYRSCCGVTNRGVALLGDRIFVGTIDSKLLALSARTGKLLWEVSVTGDYPNGYSITGAPIAFGDLVVTGVGGGDYPNRGFIAAYDAATGKPRWRFDTIPGPGKPGRETWPNSETWKVGGGATWLTGSYDPQRDVLLWGVGNPAPNHNAVNRKGDNLYTDSVVALKGSTGELLWHFQFTPGDDHDWDAVQTPVIVDKPNDPVPHQLIWANRNGFFYALNRDNGEFLHGAAFVKQTWARGLDPKGRPIRIPEASPSPTGTLVYPGVQGATNWWSPSYDPALDLMFIPAIEHAGLYYSTNNLEPKTGELYLSGFNEAPPGLLHFREVVAVKASDSTVAWVHRRPGSLDDNLHLSGLTSTAGGLVFASDQADFFALDAQDGKLLWNFASGGRITASPVAFSIDGTEYISIAAGRAVVTFALVGGGP